MTFGWSQNCSGVVIQHELVGVWSQPQRVAFPGALEFKPGIDHILREDVTLGEKGMIFFQRVQRCF